MAYGFKLWTGPGREIVVDETTPSPGLIIDEVPIYTMSAFTLDYSSFPGITQVHGYAVPMLGTYPTQVWLTNYLAVDVTNVQKTGNKTLLVTPTGRAIGSVVVVLGF